MGPQRLRLGRGEHPVVVVDDLSGDTAAFVSAACALAPFPPARTAYPGLRRIVTEADTQAMALVETALQRAAPFIAGGFDCDRFDLLEASFSLVTRPADTLAAEQRVPHFDSPDPDDLAVMLYLSPTAGTAFYRQRATEIETVTSVNAAAFIAAARADGARRRGYIGGSDPAYEQIGRVDGLCGRLLAYPGALLHSGLIGREEALSPDPRTGRLTLNMFVRLRRP